MLIEGLESKKMVKSSRPFWRAKRETGLNTSRIHFEKKRQKLNR